MIFLNAVLPIFLLIGLGRALAATSLLDREGWSAVERIGLYVLFPALIVSVLATAQFNVAAVSLIGVLVAAQVLMALFGLAAHRGFGTAGPSTASIIQSNVRWNSFIGLSLAQALLGNEGVALMSVAAAGMIPTANVISVSAFEAYGGRRAPVHHKIRSVMTNPLIVACVIGTVLLLTGTKLTGALKNGLDILSGSAIAIGLLSAGAAIEFSGLSSGRARLFFWSLVRLLGLPLIVVACAYTIQLSGLPRSVAIMAAATPTATNCVILARQLGGDTVLAANLVAAQSVLSLVTIPALLWLFGA